jgi:hypothetical protein
MTDGNLTGEVLEAAVAKTEDPAKSKPEADPGSVEAAQEVHEEADHDSLVPVTGSLVGEEEVPYQACSCVFYCGKFFTSFSR